MCVCTYGTEKEQTSIVDGLVSAILMLIDYICIKNSYQQRSAVTREAQNVAQEHLKPDGPVGK